jgi:hypothetical protein
MSETRSANAATLKEIPLRFSATIGKAVIDPPSDNWLGHRCNVNEPYDPAFLRTLSELVEKGQAT